MGTMQLISVLLCICAVIVLGEIDSRDDQKSCKLVLPSDYSPLLPIIFESDNNKIVRLMKNISEVSLNFKSNLLYKALCVSSTKSIIVNKLTCEMGILLQNGQSIKKSEELACKRSLRAIIKTVNETCDDDGELYKIGFNIMDDLFYPIITVCFIRDIGRTVYTHHVIHGKSINARQTSIARPIFIPKKFFKAKIRKIYFKRFQLRQIVHLLGDAELAASKISNVSFFKKGQLSPPKDFDYLQENYATYYYINTAPIWRSVDDGNWKNLEHHIRNLAVNKGCDFNIYTGTTSETLSIEDINSNHISIFLGKYLDSYVIPVPEVLWKVVHDRTTNKAIAFAVQNDPHATSLPEFLHLRTNVCEQVSWVSWNTGDFQSGHTSCYAVDDLRQSIPEIPDIGNVDLLV